MTEDFSIPCPECGAVRQWRRSPRKHGRPGRYFVVCKSCDYESQATDAGPFDTNPSKHRASPITSHMVSARLTDREHEAVSASNLNVHEIIRDWLLTNGYLL